MKKVCLMKYYISEDDKKLRAEKLAKFLVVFKCKLNDYEKKRLKNA